MDYSLAKELELAGFQRPMFGRGSTVKKFPNKPYKAEGQDSAYNPTLEELIEACGERFNSLGVVDGQWWAAEKPAGLFIDTFPSRTNGNSVTEAVARLWLALNKK
jgi:hypothetical protein